MEWRQPAPSYCCPMRCMQVAMSSRNPTSDSAVWLSHLNMRGVGTGGATWGVAGSPGSIAAAAFQQASWAALGLRLRSLGLQGSRMGWRAAE